MALQNLILPILSVFRSAGLQQASGALRGLTQNFDSLAGKIGLAAGSFGAFSALTSARQFTIDSVNATARFERNILGLNQVFENVTPQIINFTKQVENYGLSQSQAAQASVFLGSVLKQYGFSVQQSADQTERLVTLAQDLATTYGYDVQEALLAITALFRGEYDPIEKFGVAMKQSEVNARLAAEGMSDLKGEALANAQATARLTMLFERANDAVGAFGRASDTLYGSQQRLNAIIGNLQLAFGAPLQRPLSEVNNIMADLAQEFGPQVVEIADAIAESIQAATPTIKVLGETFFLTIAPLEQVITLLNVLIELLGSIAVPVATAANSILNILVKALDVVTTSLQRSSRELGNWLEQLLGLENIDFEKYTLPPLFDVDATEDYLDRLIRKNKTAMGEFYDDVDFALNGVKRLSATELKAATESADEFEVALRGIATGAKDAEGKLGGLSGVFERIDDAIAKSNAKTEMEQLGLSAGFIEEVLTRPNWAEIFAKIAYYAKITASEVQKVFVPGVGLIETGNTEANRQRILKQINELFGVDTKKTGAKTGKDFFEGLQEEAAKQTAANRLRGMKASEGLIAAILGSQEWEKTYKRILADGTSGLQKLQNQFSKTATGIKEITEAAEAAAKANEELRKTAQDAIDANVRNLESLADKARDFYNQVKQAADDFKRYSMDTLATVKILPDFERELGRFETAIVGTISNIQSELLSAVRSGLITDDSFRSLSAWVNTEAKALENIAKRRDDLAKRAALSESLIKEYQGALTSALKLTSLFSRLKRETEEVTITEVSQGVIKLGSTLKEFGITVSRTYEQTIEETTNKSSALIDEFRTMTQKARDFAANLVKLRDMGLDPMLFSDLVQAGVEAGGETAQALVDGGSETITEINGLFGEINKLGAELGYDVGQTMYDAGQDMTFGLLNGIRSEQQKLYDEAVAMAKTFSEAFKNNLTIAIDIPVKAAEKALEVADKAVTEAKTADIGAVIQLDTLIRNATKALEVVKGEANRIGILFKRNVFEAIRADVLSGAKFNLGGITAGLTSAELIPRAGALGSQSVQNYFELVVNAGLGADGTQIGQQIVNEILKYERSSGNVFQRAG